MPDYPTNLSTNECHLWLVEHDMQFANLRVLQPLLSDDERTRMASYLNMEDSRKFAVRRGLLRSLLGYYQGRSPHDVQFTTNPYGKIAVQGIEFNLSHTYRYTLYAFTRHNKVGVDIEFVRPLKDLSGVAAEVMNVDELAQLNQLDHRQKPGTFFRLWTCKEAVTKADGRGLSVSLKQFGVQVRPGRSPRLTGELAGAWTLYDVSVPDGWSAALAIDTPHLTISQGKISLDSTSFIY